MRKIDQTYQDPLDLIWLHAAAEMGMRVERSSAVNASWNGGGVLTIGTPETLDPDDTLAQMILHEACHSLCEGPESLALPDWGLGGAGPADAFHEHACLRLQAALADRFGMRPFFAATTMFRAYYDALPADPLKEGDDPAIPLANAGWQRATQGSWSMPIHNGLRRTALIAAAVEGIATDDSLWRLP